MSDSAGAAENAPPGARLTPRLHILGAAALFATGGAVIKSTSLPAIEVAAARSAVAALVLFALLPSWRRFWTRDALVVGAAYGATMVLFVVASKWTTAANAILLQATAPLWVLALSPLLLGEHVAARELRWAALIAAGLGLIFAGREAAQLSAPEPLLGNLFATASGVTWAFTVVGLRWLSSRTPRQAARDPAGAAVIAGNVLACAACLPFARSLGQATGTDLAAAAWLGAVQIGLAYVLLTRGVREVRAALASLLLLAEPVLATLLTWAVHGERPSGLALVGGALILTAAAGIARRQAAPRPDPK